jgi:hypothetical protein
MDVQAKLNVAYKWLVEIGLDDNQNMVMPWNHRDTAVEWAMMNLYSTPIEELREFRDTTEHPLDRLIIERIMIDLHRSQASNRPT